jgi:hypothetical protein
MNRIRILFALILARLSLSLLSQPETGNPMLQARNNQRRLSRIFRRQNQFALALGTLIMVLFTSVTVARAQTYTGLYSFTGGADGGYPVGPLILDTSGNIYGTHVSRG